MPSVKTKRISTLIESQLPEFITSEYELFGKFIQKYYEQQEVQGGTLDIINNIQKYADIDYYEKNLLRQFDTLVTSISTSDTTIVLEDATSFPEKNGYVRIDNEIISMNHEQEQLYTEQLEVLAVTQLLVIFIARQSTPAQMQHHIALVRRFLT